MSGYEHIPVTGGGIARFYDAARAKSFFVIMEQIGV